MRGRSRKDCSTALRPRCSAGGVQKVLAAHIALKAVVHRRVLGPGWPGQCPPPTGHRPPAEPGVWRVSRMCWRTVSTRAAGIICARRKRVASRRCALRCGRSRASRPRHGTTGPVPSPQGCAEPRQVVLYGVQVLQAGDADGWCRGRRAASATSCVSAAGLHAAMPDGRAAAQRPEPASGPGVLRRVRGAPEHSGFMQPGRAEGIP